jgi:VCBS repeat-containing protein
MYFADDNGTPLPLGTEIINVGDNGGLFIKGIDGSATFDPNGEFDYLNAGESITTSITYNIVSDNGELATASVSVDVAGVGGTTPTGAVIANDDWITLSSNVLGDFQGDYDFRVNDTDSTNTGLIVSNYDIRGTAFESFSVVEAGYNGSSMWLAGSEHWDTPYNVADSAEFSYTVENANGDSDSATVTLEFDGSARAQDLGEQALYTVSLKDTENFTFNVSDVFTAGSDHANNYQFDETYNEYSFVDGMRTWGSSGTLTDLGDGDFSFSPNDSLIGVGELYEFDVAFAFTSATDVTTTATVRFDVFGQSEELITGSNIVAAQDDVITITESLANGVVGLLLNNDSPGVSIAEHSVIDTSNSSNQYLNISVDSTGLLSLDGNGGFRGLAENQVESYVIDYTVVDQNGNYDTATATVNVVGEGNGIYGAAPAFDIYEDTTLTFDESSLIGGFNDADIGPDISYGQGLSVSAIDDSNTTGSLIQNQDGSYTYDPTIAYDFLNEGEADGDSIGFTVVSDDGSSETFNMYISVWGVDDPIV